MAKQSTDLNRDAILEAALACIQEYGAENVQITQIAARAGVSTRTLHRYFPEKDLLFCYAACRFLSRIYNALAEAYEKADKTGLSGLDRLLLLLSCQRKYYKTDALEAMLFIDVHIHWARYGMKRNSWALQGGARLRDIVIGNLRAGIEDKSIRPDLQPESVADLISATYNGIMQRTTFLYRSQTPDAEHATVFALYDAYIDMLARYLRAS